jgi:hypothetical protein
MNITQASRDDPHNKVEMLVDGNNVLTLLQQEFSSLNGPPEIASCPVTMGTVVKGVLVGEFPGSGQTFWVQMAGKIGAVDSKLKACNSDKLDAAPEVEQHYGMTLGEYSLENMNRMNQEILVPDWLLTSHVTLINSSDWLFTCFGRFQLENNIFGKEVRKKDVLFRLPSRFHEVCTCTFPRYRTHTL